MQIPFTKMHGLGNDYVYVNTFEVDLSDVGIPTLARRVSDRHRGIGSDGLILIAPPTDGVDADVRMEMYNADGSRGEMCGNGIRCVAKYALDRGLTARVGKVPQPQRGRGTRTVAANGANDDNAQEVRTRTLTPALSLSKGEGDASSQSTHQVPQPQRGRGTLSTNDSASEQSIAVQTDRGVLMVDAFAGEDGTVERVRVDMGLPILVPSAIPTTLGDGSRCVAVSMQVGDHSFATTSVSMGNPHAVTFIDDVVGFELEKVGPLVERHAAFPNRVNFHVVEVHSPNEATMRTWERGSGVTQACGTGACAVLVAGVLEGRLSRSATLHLPGGDLLIEWPADGASILMTGPAEEVFSGVWPISA